MTDYAAVLIHRHPDREWTINANDYDQLTMLDGGEKPTKESLESAWPDVKNQIIENAALQTQRRASALAKLAALGLTIDEIAALVG